LYTTLDKGGDQRGRMQLTICKNVVFTTGPFVIVVKSNPSLITFCGGRRKKEIKGEERS
jgi:hypothetical protein